MLAGFKFSKLFGVIDTGNSTEISPVEMLRFYIRAGVTVALLKHSGDMNSHLETAADLLKKSRETNTKLLIYNDIEAAKNSGSDGVLLEPDGAPAEKARQLLGEDSLIGLSAHTIEKIRSVSNQPVDFIMFESIFKSAATDALKPPLGLELLALAAQILPHKPIVAAGGITLENINQAIEAGAQSAAAISCIYNAQDPGKLIALLNRPQKSASGLFE